MHVAMHCNLVDVVFAVSLLSRGTTMKANGKTVHVGKTGIRDRDKTGHRTGNVWYIFCDLLEEKSP